MIGWIRRLVAPLAMTVLLVAAVAARGEGWHSAQPLPPSESGEQSSIGVPVPLGHIGDIEFWAPNRGLLITAGTEAIPAGLYYYNGVTWRELSNVCGGADGRIAWAGPDEFWTISDQQAGQQLGGGVNAEQVRQDVSLCHFVNGQVVASYAEPIGTSTSYAQMDAAACSGPDDCWFAGERLSVGPNSGAFHLHWNGTTMTAVPSLESFEAALEDPAHRVTGLAFYGGRLYESVQVQPEDPTGPGESSSQPSYLHRINEGASNPFVPLLVFGPPEEFEGEPSEFAYDGSGGFKLSEDAGGVWAVSKDGTVLHLPGESPGTGNQFQQIELTDPDGVLHGAQIGGVAAEPGTDDAWVSVDGTSSEEDKAVTEVSRIHEDGTVDSSGALPESETLGRKGSAGAIVCPAANDCWVAASQGWLFHLGPNHVEDHDPAFESLISYRPRDPSVPFFAPEDFPEDVSGANPAPIPAPGVSRSATAKQTAHAPLFTNVKSKLLHRTTLALSFSLATKSHVKLVALRHKQTVAHTKSRVLPRGHHTLELRLNPRAWPTKLDLQVHAIGAVPLLPANAGGATPGGSTVVSTSYRPPLQSVLQSGSFPGRQLP